MSDLEAGVILFNENNIDWKNYNIQEEYNHWIKKHWTTNLTQFATKRRKAEKEYLPGGVATTIL